MPHYTVDEVDAKRTALIVVDMQNDFVAAGAPVETPAARAIMPGNRLLSRARCAGHLQRACPSPEQERHGPVRAERVDRGG